jgi:hypothetical protein
MKRSTLLTLAAAAVAGCGEMPTDPLASRDTGRTQQFSVNGNPGAIWTTRQCGPPDPQNANHYAIGEPVFVNGAGFAPHEKLDWFVRGNPGGSSADPDIVVASGGPQTAGDQGAFCFQVYTVQADDDGEYRVNVNGKNDNYRVAGVDVTKTAVPLLVSTYDWQIGKTASPSLLNLFQGDEGTTRYTVSVTRGAPVNQYSVSGVISVRNSNQSVSTRTVNVEDCVQYRTGSGPWTDIICTTVGTNITIGAGATRSITYGPISFDAQPDATEYRNTARVTLVSGGALKEGVAPFTLPTTATSTVNSSVSIADPKDPQSPRTVSATGSFTYDVVYGCQTGSGSRTESNTATLSGTGLTRTASANVTVNCRSLTVSKTANTTYNRTYNWQIAKTAAFEGAPITGAIVLSEPGSRTIDYTVTMTGGFANSGFGVSGTITVGNASANGVTARINSVSDVISPSITATITSCTVSFPALLAAGSSFTCQYTAALPDNSARTNTATVVRQHRRFDAAGAAVDIAGTHSQQATAAVTFGAPTVETNRCVDVTDNFNNGGDVPLAGGTNHCHPGTGTAPGTHVRTFTYTRQLTSGGACSTLTIPNTAKFAAVGNSGYNGSASAGVTLTVSCGQCTLTQGYWKNHGDPQTSRYDATWAQVGGRDAMFLNSGMSWITVFNTPPKGDAWYNLAHQYMAAVLNGAKGADTSAVDVALARAQQLLESNPPGSNLKNLRNEFISLAGILGSYNEGTLPGGPTHCSGGTGGTETSP